MIAGTKFYTHSSPISGGLNAYRGIVYWVSSTYNLVYRVVDSTATPKGETFHGTTLREASPPIMNTLTTTNVFFTGQDEDFRPYVYKLNNIDRTYDTQFSTTGAKIGPLATMYDDWNIFYINDDVSDRSNTKFYANYPSNFRYLRPENCRGGFFFSEDKNTIYVLTTDDRIMIINRNEIVSTAGETPATFITLPNNTTHPSILPAGVHYYNFIGLYKNMMYFLVDDSNRRTRLIIRTDIQGQNPEITNAKTTATYNDKDIAFFYGDYMYYINIPYNPTADSNKLFRLNINTNQAEAVNNDSVLQKFAMDKQNIYYIKQGEQNTIYKLSVNQPPNKPTIQDYSKDIYNPTTTSVIPYFHVSVTDPDSDMIRAYEITYTDTDTNNIVYTYENTYSVPVPSGTILGISTASGKLSAGKKYSVKIRIQDVPGDWSDWSDLYYFRTVRLPEKPIITSLTNNQRTNQRPVIEFNIGRSEADSLQSFAADISLYQVDSNTGKYPTTKTTSLLFTSEIVDDGIWEVFDGTNWISLPTAGVKQSQYTKARLTPNRDFLINSKATIKIKTKDKQFNIWGEDSDTVICRIGNSLKIQTLPVDVGTTRPNRCFVSYIGSKHTTGVTYTIELSNNALDETPTWQDVTQSYIQGTAATLTNMTKTAAHWAMAARVYITVDGTVLDPVYVDAIGGSVD